MTPRIELTRDFCAGIGPLQLSVVLVMELSELLSQAFTVCAWCVVSGSLWFES